ncbi:hypothetical protein O0I10_012357 [Lichtheimia ornata]|uniref:Transmembrane protein n=1 Tax=Lichtheimia ornata TaxID=688661 RepID=A0AAD7XT43_9FUNG|nr:uncharacterized protein O0I10_012357 [Lichtheimia ornata]KAJ8652013.1 hypothetical protein O0I10_012357 [Lichtheimia ornata]
MEPHSPSSTTPLLPQSPTSISSSSAGSSSGGGGKPRYRSIHRVPTFMQTSVPNRRSIVHAFLNMTMHMMLELVFPIALYYALRTILSPLWSLVLAGVPTAIMVVIKGFREHKVDMMGLLMLLGFAVSVLLAMVESDPKLYLLRESAMTSAMGLMLFATLIPFRWKKHVLRPFMFYVARQIAVTSTMMLDPPTIRLHWDWFWRNWRSFRAFFRALTLLWALGLLSEFALRVLLIYTIDDVDDIVYYSNVYMFAVTLTLGTLTIASTLLFRHLFNREQAKSKSIERQQEIEEIIARAAEEENTQRSIQ